jgi:hypothetical protein
VPERWAGCVPERWAGCVPERWAGCVPERCDGAPMSDIEQLSYTDIMPKVGELADELLNHPDEEVRAQIEELLDWVDVFHREGLHRVVDLILAWRGDLFLEQVQKDEIVGPFLSVYDLNDDLGDEPMAEEPEDEPAGTGGIDALSDNGDFS